MVAAVTMQAYNFFCIHFNINLYYLAETVYWFLVFWGYISKIFRLCSAIKPAKVWLDLNKSWSLCGGMAEQARKEKVKEPGVKNDDNKNIDVKIVSDKYKAQNWG